MALYGYNKTTAVRALPAGNPIRRLKSAASAGKLGPKFDLTEEFRGLTAPDFALLEGERVAGNFDFHWSEEAEYPTPGLLVATFLGAKGDPGDSAVDAGPDLVLGTEDDVYPVLSKILHFDEPDFETGHDRAIEVFDAAPYKFRILQVFCTITRGAPNAQMYLCCHPGGNHEPHSDKFDASSPGQIPETSTLHDRIIETGEDVYAFCSTDYVLGRLTMMYQRIAE